MKIPGLQGGSGQDSYSQNSRSQNHVFNEYGKRHLSEALHLVLSTFLHGNVKTRSSRNPSSSSSSNGRYSSTTLHNNDSILLRVADLGCSYGPNTLEHARFIAQAIQQEAQNIGEAAGADDDEASAAAAHHITTVELQYFFSDLPGNDFNSLFGSLLPIGPQLQNLLMDQNIPISSSPRPPSPADPHQIHMTAFAAGVPGSFYGRLFPTESLHLAVCNFSLHWLSQVPSNVVDRNSEAWNGGHVWIHGSRPKVCEAYAQQFQIDAKAFLRSRLQELVEGGVLFIIAGSRSEEHPTGFFSDVGDANDILMADFAACWQDMVHEGEVSEEERDMFNIPYYNFHLRELETALEGLDEEVMNVEIVTMTMLNKCASMPTELFREVASNKDVYGAAWANIMATLTKRMVEAHLGQDRAARLYTRFQQRATHRASFFTPCSMEPPTFVGIVATIRRRLM